MPKRDSRIDDHIAKAGAFARPILEHFRATMHRVVPECEEAIKWGMPHFTHKGKNVAGMAAFKAHASFGVHGETTAPEGLGQFGKLKTLADLPPDAEIIGKLREAADRIESVGTALRPRTPKKPRPEIPVPSDLAAALDPPARAFLEGLAPSHRREYLEWITEAKRPETRANRVAQSAEWLSQGKKRNWKYEKC